MRSENCISERCCSFMSTSMSLVDLERLLKSGEQFEPLIQRRTSYDTYPLLPLLGEVEDELDLTGAAGSSGDVRAAKPAWEKPNPPKRLGRSSLVQMLKCGVLPHQQLSFCQDSRPPELR